MRTLILTVLVCLEAGFFGALYLRTMAIVTQTIVEGRYEYQANMALSQQRWVETGFPTAPTVRQMTSAPAETPHRMRVTA
jgi:hypothetical protein